MSDMPRRAYSYARFSSGAQADGDSERRQTEWPAVVSAEQGWSLDDTLAFIDRGRSGFHGANRKATAALTQFLALVERGRIARGSVLVIENIDRLSRQDVDTAHDLFRGIIRAGVWICTRTPFRVYKGEKDASFIDLLEPIWIMYCAYMESLKKSQRVASSWEAQRRQARKDGTPTQARPPWWLGRNAGGFAVLPGLAALFLRLHQMAQEGMGCAAIVVRLQAEGVANPGRSGRWRKGNVQLALKTRQALGEYQPCRCRDGRHVPDGPPIPGYYPAIMTEAEWQRTQAAIAGRRGKCGRPGKGRINLFTGLIAEAATGRPMSLKTRRQHGKSYPYLMFDDVPGCQAVRYDDAESCILDTLAMLRPEDVLDPAVRNDERELRIAALTARQTALDERQRRLQADAADPSKDYLLPVLDEVSADLKRTAKELDTLKLESLTGRAEALTEAQTLRQLRDRAEGPERDELDRRIKAALPSVVSGITIRSERVSPRRSFHHLSIRLRSGAVREVTILPRGR